MAAEMPALMARAETRRCSDGAATAKPFLARVQRSPVGRKIGIEILRRHGGVAKRATDMHRDAARFIVEQQARGIHGQGGFANPDRCRPQREGGG